MSTQIQKKLQYILGYTTGTNTEAIKNPQLGSAYVIVKGISNADIALRDAPAKKSQGVNTRVQTAVTTSLERSLVENVDIWSELAKH